MSLERQEGPTGWWVKAYRYTDMQTAGIAYSVVRDIIFENDVDASVYRVQLNGMPHVILISEETFPAALEGEVGEVFEDGLPTDMPPEISAVLLDRRRELKMPGVFWERRGA
jgi:hypothetical protein